MTVEHQTAVIWLTAQSLEIWRIEAKYVLIPLLLQGREPAGGFYSLLGPSDAGSHLSALGYRKISFFSPPSSLPSSHFLPD